MIPPYRLKRVQDQIRRGKTRPFLEMFRLTPEQWSDDLRDLRDANGEEYSQARINYDQAWSMVHYLVNADGGKYRAGFSGLIRDVAGGTDWRLAFRRRFGQEVRPFEDRYKRWWPARKPDATAGLYTEAVVATMTSYFARAVAQGQQFATAEDFFREARSGTLKAHRSQWLPPRLLNRALVHARLWQPAWSIDKSVRTAKLVLTWPTGTVYTGTFTHSRGKCDRVKVMIAQKQ